MKHHTKPAKKIKKNDQGFSKPNLSITEFSDLPIGIIVCTPLIDDAGSIVNLMITYCNPFALTLLNIREKILFLDEIAFLKTLLKPACIVIETGVSSSIESYDPETSYWIASLINWNNENCIIYLQDTTLKKQYEETIKHKLQLDAIISDIARRLINITSNELDTYTVETLAQIGTHTRADQVYIFSLSADGRSMTNTHAWGTEGLELVQEPFRHVDTSHFPWWYQKIINQETILVRSPDEWPISADREKETMLAQGIKSLLVVPMVFDTKNVGFIGFNTIRQPRSWDKNDINSLKTFAALLVTAKNRLRREQLLQRANERLEGLNRISNALKNSNLLDEQPDLAALKHIYAMIPCEIGVAFRIDKTGQFAYAENRIKNGKWEAWPRIRVLAKYLHNETLSQGQEVVINELQADTPGFPRDLNPYKWGHRSFLAMPMFAHQQYIGLLILLDKSPDFFTQEYVSIAREVAGQLSILLFQEEVNRQLAKQASKLTENNQFLQAVIDSIPAGLVLWQPVRKDGHIIDFTYLLINPVIAALTGLNQEEVVGQSFITLFPHVLKNGLFEKLVDKAESGETQRFQFLDRGFWGDFSLVWVGNNLLLTVNDITQIKKIKEQLQETNINLEKRVADRTAEIQQLSAMQRAILKYAGLAIAVSDTTGVIQLVNPALEALTGYEANELIGQVTLGALRDPEIHQQQIDQLRFEMNNSLLSGEELIAAYYLTKNDFLQRENILLTKQGKRILVLSTSSGLYDDQGTLIGFVDLATDISKLKAIEQELKQASQRIQLATVAGKLGVWEWNLLTNELVLDTNFFTLFGVDKRLEGNIMDDFEPLVHPEDLPLLYQHIQKAIKERTPLDVEFRVILPTDKSIHYIKADGLVLQNELGKTDRIIGVIRDQTATKRADQALKESEAQYRSLVNHLKEVVFQIDTTGHWIYLNPAWQEVTGFTTSESLGKPFLDSVFPDDRAHNQELCDLLMAREKIYCEHVIRYIHKDGGYRWIEVFAQVTQDQDNQITGIAGTLTDITGRKEAEVAILESEQRFRDIAENVDEIYWIRDIKEPRFIYMNLAYEKFSGQNRQLLYENPFLFLNFILEEDREKVLNFFLHNGLDQNFQFRARHQDGSIRFLSVKLFTIENENGLVIRRIGVATDITNSIEKELILQESLEKEINLNRLKSQFIAIASHEFRTPLATISSSIDLVKYYIDKIDAGPSLSVINKHIDNIYQKVFLLNDLISDTLTISKIDEGKLSFNPELTDLVSLCEDILTLYFDDRLDNRFVEFIVSGNPVDIMIDKNLTEHILVNLLSNAFKFSTKNPILKLSFEQKAVCISVKDEGIGIPSKDIPNLFGKFFRASNANTFQGTGLGLAICQEYIILQKGYIEFESTEGVGTTFKITFPY
ncbi:PAS domain S-box protein [Spirosoma sp. HMF3257]|nr:PAS domain S-box protein [Spirosoma telluris]